MLLSGHFVIVALWARKVPVLPQDSACSDVLKVDSRDLLCSLDAQVVAERLEGPLYYSVASSA